ncbi:hypothetical protein ABPG72_007660 [Tetrahymena utriculariae]
MYSIIFNQGDRNNYCEHDNLKRWVQATAIVLFTNSGIQIIKFIHQIFLNFTYQAQEILFYFTTTIQVLIFLGMLVVTIGLTVTSSSDCGQLYKLILAFYIKFYIFLGFGLCAAPFFI